MTWRNGIKSWNISRAEMCRDIFGIFQIVFFKTISYSREEKLKKMYQFSFFFFFFPLSLAHCHWLFIANDRGHANLKFPQILFLNHRLLPAQLPV